LGPFLLLVNFHSSQYHPFLERTLSVKIGEETATGIVDFLIAQGEQIPKAPYFCLHEYKPEEGVSNDPFGQLLIAMVAAQQANELVGKQLPIYGAFIIGRNFYFVILEDKQYAVSDIFTATQTDILDIYLILQKVKKHITQVLS